MGRAGPPPKPLPLRVLHGARPFRTDLIEPQPPALQDATPPEWLDEASQVLWVDTVRNLDAAHVLRQVDLPILEAFVAAFATFRRAAALVQAAGPIVKGSDGHPKKNPAVAVQRDSMNMVRLLGRELGMSPAARTAMAVRPTSDESSDPAAAYLTGS